MYLYRFSKDLIKDCVFFVYGKPRLVRSRLKNAEEEPDCFKADLERDAFKMVLLWVKASQDIIHHSAFYAHEAKFHKRSEAWNVRKNSIVDLLHLVSKVVFAMKVFLLVINLIFFIVKM